MTDNKRTVVLIISLCIVLVLAAMAFIFINSAKDGSASGNQSGKLADFLINLFYQGDLKPEDQTLFESRLRMFGHYSEFVLLGLAVGLFVSVLTRFERKKWYFFFAGWIGCAVYALTDEWHQMYVPGRAAEWSDVMVDSLGALTGTLIMMVLSLTLFQLFKGIKKKTDEVLPKTEKTEGKNS